MANHRRRPPWWVPDHVLLVVVLVSIICSQRFVVIHGLICPKYSGNTGTRRNLLSRAIVVPTVSKRRSKASIATCSLYLNNDNDKDDSETNKVPLIIKDDDVNNSNPPFIKNDLELLQHHPEHAEREKKTAPTSALHEIAVKEEDDEDAVEPSNLLLDLLRQGLLGLLTVVSFGFTLIGVAATCGMALNLLGYGYHFSLQQGIVIDTLEHMRQDNQFRMEIIRSMREASQAMPKP